LEATTITEAVTTDDAPQRTKLKIAGMTCANCTAAIERSIGGLEGVSAVDVNLAAETAMVEYDSEKVKLSQMEQAVVDAGYEVISESAIIKIGGMTCANCTAAIEKAIMALDGVSSVSVNLGTEKAIVNYNPRTVTLKDMRRAVEEAGYQYLGTEDEVEVDQEEEALRRNLAGKRNRFLVGFAIAIPLMVLMNVGVEMPSWGPWAQFFIATPAFIYTSDQIFKGAYRALRHRLLNMDVMYSMGIGVAYVASVFGTLGVLPMEFLFYETSLMLASFLMIGRFLEARAKGKTSDAIKKLIGLQAKTAIVVRDGQELEIRAEDIEVGDVVVVRPGEKVATDGSVQEGSGYVDESMITGEPIPNLKSAGDEVVGGTINKNSVLKFEATRVGRDTVLQQIIRMVEEAQGTKPQIEKIADKAVSWFIPVVLTIAISAFIVWYVVVGETALFSTKVLVSILVIACPCALGLATPTAVTVGLGRGAELGILTKTGDALEAPDKLTTMVFDKTGTLTEGEPDVTDIVAMGLEERELLSLAAAVEKGSLHPLAEAVVRRAETDGVAIPSATDHETISGKGVLATVDGRRVMVGNPAFIDEQGIPIEPALQAVDALQSQGKTVILVAEGGKVAGVIAIADTIRESSKAAVAELHRMGIETVMITGDNSKTADAVAGQLGIKRVLAEVLPQDKAAEVKALQAKGEVVAFVGDGINDAPALAQSNVGIAIGGGTDVAVESGDIVLMRDDPMDAVTAVQISRKVMQRIKQNLFWAFAYNTALIPVAAGLLWPTFGIQFRPELAGLAMALSSVTVITLSLMLRKYVPPSRRASKE
jgi:Cu+-exporting ATPase